MIVPLDARHLPAAMALLARAGLPSGVHNVGRYLRWQPDGGWGEVVDDTLLGMVTLLRFGHVGFVGCMAVEPALQGAGHGRRLLEHAHAEGRRAGIATFLLEATPIGERLYRRCGYLPDGGSTVLERRSPSPPAETSVPPTVLDPKLREAIFSLDLQVIGHPRRTMIAGLIDEAPPATLCDAGGALRAFGLRVGPRVGPVLALDPGAGREVVDRIVEDATVASVPTSNAPALAALEAHGFVETRRTARMFLGPPAPFAPASCWALASAGAG